jgi:uncharacterized YigZ family protein
VGLAVTKNIENQTYSVPTGSFQTEFEIKRSKFLTFVGCAGSKPIADDFVRKLRLQHPKANHVCWAYIIGSPKSTERSMSDDGEPSGTAGMPMLKVLEHSGLGDIVVAVVRYFGGIKLGTGGLQRAYSDAVSLVLQDLPTQNRVTRITFGIVYDYVYEGHVSRLLSRYDVENISTNYEQQISASLDVAKSQSKQLEKELINITAGNVKFSKPPFPCP